MMWSVEKNTTVPIGFEYSYDGPDRFRHGELVVYTSLREREYKDRTYLVAGKKVASVGERTYTTAPLGSLVHVNISYGSRRRTYAEYEGWFVVEYGEHEEEHGNFRIRTKNLQKLVKPDKEQLAEAEAEIINHGTLPSRYDPVRTIYFFARRFGDVRVNTTRADSLATQIVLELLRKRPEIIAELGFDVKEVRKALGHAPTISPRVRALKKAMERDASKRRLTPTIPSGGGER
ncbi:hypothetical protein [Archaeoglobus neptunius]|uniref:hypothetical protein n=1 Tax=Archaeoglobus neptunius TaxID=2798580 RepID=UPI0019253CE6|nr:hypothetical protein [Archaeoglobus neptunius]